MRAHWLLGAIVCTGCGTTETPELDSGPIEPFASTVTVDRTSGITADGLDAAQLVVRVVDANGAPVAGRTVAFDGPSDVVLTVPAPTDAGGETTARATSFVAGMKRIDVAVDGVALDDMPRIEFVAGAAAKLVVLDSPTNGFAGSYLTVVSVGIADAHDNVVTTAATPIRVELATNAATTRLYGDTQSAPVEGVATFFKLGVSSPASGIVLRAIASGLAPAETGPFDVIATTPAVCVPALPGAPSIRVGDAVWSMLDEDFNGDGHRDLAMLQMSAQASSLAILHGLGDGRFLAPERYVLGALARAVASGDFDGDGDADLVVAASGASQLNVFINQGDGTFAASSVGVPEAPRAIVGGDFDGNQVDDVAVRTDHSVWTFAGVGNGTFASPTQYALGVPPYSASYTTIAYGDLNGDGVDDLFTSDSLDGGNHVVLLGSAGGSFQALQPVAGYGATTNDAAIADVNNDNVNDVVSGFSVRIGNGDGTFATPVNIGSLFHTASSAVASDIDGDGTTDVIATTENGRGLFLAEVLIGIGDGTFAAGRGPALNKFSRALAVADFDEDGHLDVVTAQDNGGLATLTVHRGDGTGALAGPEVNGGDWDASGAFWEVVGDFDGNGTLDLVATDQVYDRVGVQLRAADGSLTAMPTHPFSDGHEGVATDIDGDSKLDFVGLATSGVSWLRGNGDGTLQAPVSSALPDGWRSALRLGRIDAGTTDYVVVVNPSTDKVTIAFGSGTGSWTGAIQYSVGSSPNDVQIADVDGDNDNDLVVANRGFTVSGSVSVLLNTGTGFANATSYGVIGRAESVAVADLDGDAKLDILASDSASNKLHFFRGLGDGTFEPQVKIDIGVPSYRIRLVDLDGDSVLDLVASSDGVLVLRGLGNVGFGPASLYGVSHARGPVLADLDGDGEIDVLQPMYESGFVILHRRGCQ